MAFIITSAVLVLPLLFAFGTSWKLRVLLKQLVLGNPNRDRKNQQHALKKESVLTGRERDDAIAIKMLDNHVDHAIKPVKLTCNNLYNMHNVAKEKKLIKKLTKLEKSYGFLIANYRFGAYHWCFAILVKDIALALAGVVFSEGKHQCAMASVVLCLYLAEVHRVQPYSSPMSNQALPYTVMGFIFNNVALVIAMSMWFFGFSAR